MSEINTPICTHCGHPLSAHRPRERLCPLYGKDGKLRGWTGREFTTDPPPEPKLYTASELKLAKLETVERVMALAERTKIRPFGYKDETVYEIRGDFVEKLKEEIENDMSNMW